MLKSNRKVGLIGRIVLFISSISILLCMLLGIAYIYFTIQLPDVEQLKNIQLQEPLRIYTNDGQLIAEFGSKKRIPISLELIPQSLINAVLATEDQRFYDHPGIDFQGLVRAAIEVIKTGKKSQGASTITMQVARNFFLSTKKTYARKLNEILLAIKIDRELSKDTILELYFNKIYFGQGAYGIAAAAKVYYNRPLNELNLAELAMLAGIPKAPSKINPINNPVAAIKRRNHVLARMLDEGFIDLKTYNQTIQEPNTAQQHSKHIEIHAPYVAEIIRQELYKLLGDEVYKRGYKVYSTINGEQQLAANAAVIKALEEYDTRHGYRGPIANISDPTLPWDTYPTTTTHRLAKVITVNDDFCEIELEDGAITSLQLQDMQWARQPLDNGKVGKSPTTVHEILTTNDIIQIKKVNKKWQLTQLPEIEGALIALNPKTDEILAMVGGYNFYLNKFNHATQAYRQPGSIFKPFIYAAAIEKGYTLATKINDAPIIKQDNSQNNLIWRPQNHDHKFTGMSTVSEALIGSKNLVTIRILEDIGIKYTLNILKKFGFNTDNIVPSLSMALGTPNLSLLELTASYAAFANAGYSSQPFLISKILDADNKIILIAKPINKTNPAISTQTAFLMNTVLQKIMQKSIMKRMATEYFNRSDLAGKTGTTNDYKDTWFAGYNPDIVTVTWMGYDTPKSLHEYSWQSSYPMWLYFMATALKNTPEVDFPEPDNIVKVRIDHNTGMLANNENSYFEFFRAENAPTAITKDNTAINNTIDYIY